MSVRQGHRWSAWSDRVPPVVIGVAEGAAVFGGALLLRGVFDRPLDWDGAALRGALFAVLGTWVAHVARRHRDAPDLVAGSTAVREGRLPAEGDPVGLRVGLLHVKQRSLAVRRWGGIGIGAVVLVALGVAVVSPSGLAWMTAVLAGVALPFVTAVYGWRAEDAQKLLTELDARSPEAGTP